MKNLSSGPSRQSSTERDVLTEREKQILRLLCDGLTNREIASQMGVTSEVVKSGLKRVFRKIAVRNRTQAAVLGARSALSGASSTFR